MAKSHTYILRVRTTFTMSGLLGSMPEGVTVEAINLANHKRASGMTSAVAKARDEAHPELVASRTQRLVEVTAKRKADHEERVISTLCTLMQANQWATADKLVLWMNERGVFNSAGKHWKVGTLSPYIDRAMEVLATPVSNA